MKGTRDEKLAQKIVEKLSRRSGFVTAALKRWDEEQQVFVGAGGGAGGGGAPLDRKAFAGHPATLCGPALQPYVARPCNPM